MQYIKFTHVDAVTAVSVATEAALHGLAFPAVTGLQFLWARESVYPDPVPQFFGTCADDADTAIDGVLGLFSAADYDTMQADEMLARPSVRSIAKAARTTAVSAITVTTAAGNMFDGDETSQNRMARAILALQASTETTTLWVLTDNTVIDATQDELAEALTLAGAAQSAMWVIQ
jgi:hypothetical protein